MDFMRTGGGDAPPAISGGGRRFIPAAPEAKATASATAMIRPADGRHRRSERSRDSIVTAMIELVAGGAINPGAEEIATRAGVGLRSVFRHFRDMESLFRAMQARLAQDYEVWLVPFTAGDWRGRLAETIDRRLTTYERLLPFMRAADAHRHRSPVIEDEHRRIRAIIRARLERVVEGAFAADPAGFEALDLLLSPEAWQRLRTEQRLDPATARAVVERQVALVLPAAS